MAYGYRSCAEKALTVLGSTSIENVLSSASKDFEKYESDRVKYFNFSLSDVKKSFADLNGIYVSPAAFLTHSHPLSKTIENHFLYDVLPTLIHNVSNFYVMSMKDNKLFLVLKNTKRDYPTKTTLINRIVDVKDSIRYRKVDVSTDDFSFTSCVLDRSLVPNSDSVLKLALNQDSFFFLHDELHYWSRRDLFMFLRKFSPNTVCASVVYPVELLDGVKDSLIPFAYTFKLHGDKVIFSPDGCTSESYCQPADLRWLFSASHLIVDDEYFSVDIIKTIGAHHLFLIVKGKREVRPVRIFSGFDAIDLGKLPGVKFKCPIPNVRFSLFQRLVVYLLSLKKPDAQSAVAKFRQLAGDDLSLPEMMFFEDFATRLMKKGKSKISMVSVTEKFLDSFKKVCPDLVLRTLSSYKADMIMKQIMLTGPFEVSIKTREVKEFTPFECFTLSFLKRELVMKNHNEVKLECDTRLFGNKNAMIEFGIVECHDRRFLSNLSGSYSMVFEDPSRVEFVHYLDGRCTVNPLNKVSFIDYKSWRLLTHTFISYESNTTRGELLKASKVFLKSRSRRQFWLSIDTNYIRFADLSFPFHAYGDYFNGFGSRKHLYQKLITDGVSDSERDRTSKVAECEEIIKLFDKFHSRSLTQGNAPVDLSSWFENGLCKLQEFKSFLSSWVKRGWIFLLNDEELTEFSVDDLVGIDLAGRNGWDGDNDSTGGDEEGGGSGGHFCASSSSGKPVHNKSRVHDSSTEDPLGNFRDVMGSARFESKPNHGKCNVPNPQQGGYVVKGLDESYLTTDEKEGTAPTEDTSGVEEVMEKKSKHGYVKGLHESFLSPPVFDFNQGVHLNADAVNVFGESKVELQNKSDENDHECSSEKKSICSDSQERKVRKFFDSSSSDDLSMEPIKLRKVPEVNLGQVRVFKGESFLNGLVKLYNHFDPAPNCFRSIQSLISKKKANITKGRESYFFCQHSNFEYGHNKVVYKNSGWPLILEEICKRLEVEVGIRFNSVLINRYSPGGKINFHADDESVYDLNDNPVFTYNVVGEAKLDFKGNGQLSVLAGAGTGVLMVDKAQNLIKHRVKSLSERVSLTFRIQRRTAEWQEPKELSSICDLIDNVTESELRALKNKCILDAFCKVTSLDMQTLFRRVVKRDIKLFDIIVEDRGVTVEEVSRFACILDLHARVLINGTWSYFGNPDSSYKMVSLEISGNHIDVFDELRKEGPLRANENVDLHKRRSTGFKMFFYKLCDMIDPVGTITNKISRPLNFLRAAKLLKSLKSGNTGVISSDNFGFGERLMAVSGEALKPEMLVDPEYLKEICGGTNLFVEGIGLFGFAGCGKSKPVQEALSAIDSPLRTLVISPRRRLLEDWKTKVESKFVTFKTFETSMLENLSNFATIILDEIGLFPRGFVDLITLRVTFDTLKFKKKGSEQARLVVLGDPLQAYYFNQDDQNKIDGVNEFKALELDELKYMFYSHRLSKNMQSRVEIECLGCEDGFVDLKVHKSMKSLTCVEKDVDCVLVPSQIEKGLFPEMDNVMTMGESQGLTFNNVAIVLTENILASSDNQVMVAITRSRRKLHLVSMLNYDISEFIKRAEGRLIGKFVAGKMISKTFIKAMIGVNEVELIKSDNTIGRMEDEEKMAGDPWMKGMIDLVPDVIAEEVIVQEHHDNEPTIKVHLPITDFSYVMSFIEQNIRAKEYREAKKKGNWSNQFKDDDRNLHHKASTGPVNFESIFPRHSADDSVTFWMAVAKRLSFSNPIKEARELDKSWTKGRILFDEFIKKVKVTGDFDPNMYNEAHAEFNKVRLAKSGKLIEVHSARSDPDWDFNKFKLFMKSQLCKKAEKAFSDAKAGQTLACFSHAVLYRFSTWCRYAEKKVNKVLPENLYIHSRKNFDQLESWVKRFFRSSMCVESDYEAFDASQDASILAFEVNFLRWIGWPADVIKDYIDLKLDLGCKLGNLAIMRFTGEFGTFLFNTLANMAFTFCRYDVNQFTPIAFAGDDMCILGDPRLRSDREELLKSLKLKAKVQRMRYPMFCGWLLTPGGIIKLPSIIFERLLIAEEKGRLKDCIDSYTIEAGYAYRVGGYIEDVLDEHQMSFHQQTMRFLIKHKNLMKGSSLDILEDARRNHTDEEDIQESKRFEKKCKRFYKEIVQNKYIGDVQFVPD